MPCNYIGVLDVNVTSDSPALNELSAGDAEFQGLPFGECFAGSYFEDFASNVLENSSVRVECVEGVALPYFFGDGTCTSAQSISDAQNAIELAGGFENLTIAAAVSGGVCSDSYDDCAFFKADTAQTSDACVDINATDASSNTEMNLYRVVDTCYTEAKWSYNASTTYATVTRYTNESDCTNDAASGFTAYVLNNSSASAATGCNIWGPSGGADGTRTWHYVYNANTDAPTKDPSASPSKAPTVASNGTNAPVAASNGTNAPVAATNAPTADSKAMNVKSSFWVSLVVAVLTVASVSVF